MVKRLFLIGMMFFLAMSLLMSCGISQEDHDALVAQLNTTRQELQLTQENLEATQGKLDSANARLAAIEKVYPPREFFSSSELTAWLRLNEISNRPAATTVERLYSKALDLQEDALKDGYIISVDVDIGAEQGVWNIACVTCINGELWAWSPEFDDPIEISSVLGWTKVR